MTLYELKTKVLSMIEELNPYSEFLTDDPDISAKINEVINQIMFELVRIKKLPRYVEIPVSAGDVLDFAKIEKVCGSEVYQVSNIGGVSYTAKANGTVFRIRESGTAEIDCYVFPDRITANTKDKSYEFELPPDLMEIMPYGVAGDLLKSDVSAEYGVTYSKRYEDMLQRLDPRYQMGVVYIEGGVEV